jgi:2-keto-4-pentenoate hydratase/2-oxohepta-3-ene-1,7-dioic acid hydratase in catechol pathway
MRKKAKWNCLLRLSFFESDNCYNRAFESYCFAKGSTDFVDYEAELVIVIGKRAKDVAKEDVSGYILGYACGNDVSARDCQMKLEQYSGQEQSHLIPLLL